jgi:hypothetical protein
MLVFLGSIVLIRLAARDAGKENPQSSIANASPLPLAASPRRAASSSVAGPSGTSGTQQSRIQKADAGIVRTPTVINQHRAGTYEYRLPVEHVEWPGRPAQGFDFFLETIVNDPSGFLTFNFTARNHQAYSWYALWYYPNVVFNEDATVVTDSLGKRHKIIGGNSIFAHSIGPENVGLMIPSNAETQFSMSFEPVIDTRVTSITFRSTFRVATPDFQSSPYANIDVPDIRMALFR